MMGLGYDEENTPLVKMPDSSGLPTADTKTSLGELRGWLVEKLYAYVALTCSGVRGPILYFLSFFESVYLYTLTNHSR